MSLKRFSLNVKHKEKIPVDECLGVQNEIVEHVRKFCATSNNIVCIDYVLSGSRVIFDIVIDTEYKDALEHVLYDNDLRPTFKESESKFK